MAYIPHERKCMICRSSYSYCPHCAEYSDQPTWRAGFDTESCRTIYDVINKYRLNIISAHDAKEILDTCDLSNFENFDPVYKEDLKNIIKEAETIPEQVEDNVKESNDVVDNENTVEKKEIKTMDAPSTMQKADELLNNKNRKRNK